MATFAVLAGHDKKVEFQVHRGGCPDVSKAVKTNLSASWYAVDADSAKDAVAQEVAEYQACEQDYGVRDFRIMLCAKCGASHG